VPHGFYGDAVGVILGKPDGKIMNVCVASVYSIELLIWNGEKRLMPKMFWQRFRY
jgi:hypothetical protein